MLFAILKKVLIIFTTSIEKCTQCNIQRSMKRYRENKDKLSNQRKLYYEKNRDVLLVKSKLNQQNRNYERKLYKQQVEELIEKLKSLEEKLKHE